MILTTRYKDIPYEEAIKCAVPGTLQPDSRDKLEKSRGRVIQVETPPIATRQYLYARCEGPFYKVFPPRQSKSHPECYLMVCVHLTEIGD